MSREVQVRFCESRAVQSRPATHRCLVISGTKADAENLREEIAGVLSTMGLRLSLEKTLIRGSPASPESSKTGSILRTRKEGSVASTEEVPR